jgi:hypothetical protein
MLDDRGGWKALDTAGIRDLVHAATMAGRLAAAEKAVQLGYAIEPDHGPSGKLDHWRIAGIPAEVADGSRSAPTPSRRSWSRPGSVPTGPEGSRLGTAGRPRRTSPRSHC